MLREYECVREKQRCELCSLMQCFIVSIRWNLLMLFFKISLLTDWCMWLWGAGCASVRVLACLINIENLQCIKSLCVIIDIFLLSSSANYLFIYFEVVLSETYNFISSLSYELNLFFSLRSVHFYL